MATLTPQSVYIDRSAFYDIQGNLYNYTGTSPGERGIHELFKASCPDTFHDSRARYPPPRCLEGTRVDVLNEIFDWIAKADEKILWLSGPAGAGKSAIGQTVAEGCADASILGASFFFFRGAPGRNTEEHLIASIAYQLVTRMPEKRVQLGQIIEEDLSILNKPSHIQIQKLIIPLFSHTSSRLHSPVVLILDGLDKCQGDNNQRDIVQCIEELSTSCVPMFCVIISRPEPQIEETFNRLTSMVHRISLASARHMKQAEDDIRTYLRSAFDQIYEDHSLNTEEYWPTEGEISRLVRNSKGIFIYAYTVIKYVEDRDFDPMERMREIIVPSLGNTAFVPLDHLYRHIMGAHKNPQLMLQILTIVCVWADYVSESINSSDIERLLHLRKGAATIALRRMRSILNIKTLRLYHKSFADFISNKDRAREFFIDFKQGHASMAEMLLRYISQHTEKDYLFWYARRFWSIHCQDSGRWDKHPHLLKEISETLDYCERYRRQYLQYLDGGGFLQWFEVDKIQPISPEYHPLDIQYRLFKGYWRQMHTIFLFYEESGPQGLMKNYFLLKASSDVFWGWIYRSTIRGSYTRPCWVIRESHEFPQVQICDALPRRIGDFLSWRRLQEARKSDSARFIDGHAKVFARCLEVISLDKWSDHAQKYTACSYAHKYWRKHLSYVPPGNRIILDSLMKYECSKLRNRLPAGSIQAIQTWLKLSVIQRKMVPQIIAMGWFGKPHIVMPFEREIQKVNQTWRSFGMSTAAWLEKRTRWGLDIKMPFERDAQKPAKSGINIQWSTFGMAVTFL